jgi:hypothetical protein
MAFKTRQRVRIRVRGQGKQILPPGRIDGPKPPLSAGLRQVGITHTVENYFILRCAGHWIFGVLTHIFEPVKGQSPATRQVRGRAKKSWQP